MNTERIKMLVTLNVGQGNSEIFKKLSRELAESVESNEAATIGYEWFMDDTAEDSFGYVSYAD